MVARSPAKPWNKPNPRKAKGAGKKLTPAQLEEARARAAAAGRPYPNLIDNMAVASGRTGTKKVAKKKATPRKKVAAKKT